MRCTAAQLEFVCHSSVQLKYVLAAAHLDIAVDDVNAVQVLDAARHLQQHLQQQRSLARADNSISTPRSTVHQSSLPGAHYCRHQVNSAAALQAPDSFSKELITTSSCVLVPGL
jgi:hypothetical protein